VGLSELDGWVAAFDDTDDKGPDFAPVALDAVLSTLMAGHKVTRPVPARNDIAIWGLLEARLQSADLVILAGLNEDVWPAAADPGPWLSRGMRISAGLEPPERQQGQAAHDFEMALGGARVMLAFAERRGTAPALPSRLVQRFEAFLGEEAAKSLRARARALLDAARRLDHAGLPVPARRPIPKPTAGARPKKLSVTEIERLYRSPYDLYAKYVLRLTPLAPLGQLPDARERGSLIHDVFARFIIEKQPFDDAAAPAVLEAMAREAFAGLDAIGDRRDIWLKRFTVAAELFLEFERARDPGVTSRNAEIKGEWHLPIGFTLSGRADRIDVLNDGTLEILDFKTGSVPERKAMREFEAPQLLLEAAMAAAGKFPGIEAAQASALTYIKIGSGAKAYRPEPFAPAGDDLAAAINEASRRMQLHVQELLLKDELPMMPRIVPDAKQRFRGDYDHLARTDEWLVQEDPDF
jgi:ATP-dependent helicase/nuclease subunit B